MIFVDTSYWAALLIPRDSHHEESIRLLRAHGNAALVVSNHVVGETWTFLRRRVSHRVAVGFLDRIEATERLSLVRVSEELEDQARGWLRRHDEREYSFVDATSFALMRSLRATEVLAFDRDFDAVGFNRLRA